jgi:uncharacterized membrane protein (DUF106 family)
MVGTTIPTGILFGWLVEEYKEEPYMVRQTNLVIMSRKTNATYTIFGLPCFISLDWIMKTLLIGTEVETFA